MERLSFESAVREAISKVEDPEIPVLTLDDLGMITDLRIEGDLVFVKMTPTFIGCPAIDMMKAQIKEAAESIEGVREATVSLDMETTWSSNMMSDEARAKLTKFGIAPPDKIDGEVRIQDLDKVRCPHCGSIDTTLNSTFGSTLCRAIRYCYNCKQGFEQFKPI